MTTETEKEAAVSNLALSVIRTDGGTQPRTSISAETVEEYAEAMNQNARAFPPVTVFFDGKIYWLADGFHRYIAAGKIGMTYITADIRQGSRRDAVLFSAGANAAHGLRRTNEDKKRAVLTLLNDEEWSQWSDREIARQTYTHHGFVAKLREENNITGYISSEPQTRTYTTKHGTTATMNTSNIGKQRQELQAPTTLADEAADFVPGQGQEGPYTELIPEEELYTALTSTQQSQPMQVLTSSARDDWRTPGRYIQAVKQVLGEIDLDPASSTEANQLIQAGEIFTKEDDALVRYWYGKVFCNPPYGKTNNESNQGLFAARLVEEYEAGRVEQAILLVNLYFGYDWFAPLRGRPLCLVDHRISFLRPDTGEEGDEAKASSVFVYFGPDREKFFKVFSQFGWCCQPERF